MKLTAPLCIIVSAMLVTGCATHQDTLFTPVSSSHSNINFANIVTEDTGFNILTYEYLYNGGGVAAADINNDGLPDLFFSGNMVGSKLYLNKGGLQFEDITARSGISERTKWKTGVVMADVNGDGLIDIYACYSGPGADSARSNELYINQGVKDGVPVFREMAKAYGLDAPGTFSTTAAFFDMDNDGDLDMLLVNHADMFYNPFFNTGKLRARRHPQFGNRLYRNDNNIFTDVSESAHIAGSGLNFGLGAAISDINDDGWPDIYVTNDYDERDFLYLNNHDGTFREVLDRAAGHISEFSMGCDIADYNNDLRPDVMVLDMLPEDNHRQKLLKGADAFDKYNLRFQTGFHRQQMRNTLQLNNGTDSAGTPVFSEVANLAGVAATDWSWAPLFADYDNDGWKDLFISNGIYKDITNLDFVKYTSGYSNHFDDKKGNSEEMWKIIQDMPSTPLKSYFYRNNHDLTFSNTSASWGLNDEMISNGSVYADLDNDGDLDLVENCLGSESRILENHTNEKPGTHFLRIKLKGASPNTMAVGAKIFVRSAHSNQVFEQFPNRGFQSSVDPVLHVGLGQDAVADTIRIRWPGGKNSVLTHLRADTTVVIDETGAEFITPQQPVRPPALFTDITAQSGIVFAQPVSSFVDFKISPLLPYQVSKTGPALAKGDVNGDGLEDLLICSSAEISALYLQSSDHKFSKSSSQPWQHEGPSTITSAVFFDADSDGDSDLYVTCGGVDFPAQAKNYQDRFYVNDGKGHFTRDSLAIPFEKISGSCVRAGDIDGDGKPDLFVGGGSTPGRFPMNEESFILKNISSKGHPSFTRDGHNHDTAFAHMGIVTDAAFADLNHDGRPDLVVVGQFMPVSIFENDQGALKNKTSDYGLDSTEGWWCSLLIKDMDGDGEVDIVLGNMGTNSLLHATRNEPLTITYGDFNGDGIIDPILCQYNQGKSYPYFSRDEILDQLPLLQKKFGRYRDYADATLTDMFTEEQLAGATTLKIHTLQSAYAHHTRNNKFTLSPLAELAQASAINGIVAADLNDDGVEDLVTAGNYFSVRVQLGPLDASIGLALLGNKRGTFTPLTYDRTGLYLPGDVRSMLSLGYKKNQLFIAGRSNGPLEVLKLGLDQ